MVTKQQQIERSETLLKLLGQVNGMGIPLSQDQVSNDLDWLHRQETTLHRIAENQCNGYQNNNGDHMPAWEQRDAAKQKNIEKKVTDLLALYDIAVEFNNDPRGGSIRMILPDHSSNGWDNRTWGIYW